MKLTLTKVYRSTTDKAGQPLTRKDGSTYEKLAVKANEYGDRWISGFSGKWNSFWKEGDVVEADVAEAGQYLNLVRPDPVRDLAARVLVLENAVFKKELPTVKHDEDWLG
jgi:hypothetical protein